jgi:hypothetical protein
LERYGRYPANGIPKFVAYWMISKNIMFLNI